MIVNNLIIVLPPINILKRVFVHLHSSLHITVLFSINICRLSVLDGLGLCNLYNAA